VWWFLITISIPTSRSTLPLYLIGIYYLFLISSLAYDRRQPYLLSLLLHALFTVFNTGVQNAMPYAVDKKRYWRMDGYVPLPFETDTSGGDPEVTIFRF
jgi:hypothetical protein